MESWNLIAIGSAPITLAAFGLFAVSALELERAWLGPFRVAVLVGAAASFAALLYTGAPGVATAFGVLSVLLALEAIAAAAATPPSLERLACDDVPTEAGEPAWWASFERQFRAHCRSGHRSDNALQAAFSRRPVAPQSDPRSGPLPRL
jgi:hypothetical protein